MLVQIADYVIVIGLLLLLVTGVLFGSLSYLESKETNKILNEVYCLE